MSEAASSLSPPRPRPHLCIGVTGHRDLGGVDLDRVAAEVRLVLDRLIAGPPDEVEAPPHVTQLLSQLAEGADQMFATVALAAGAQLKTLFPFALPDYSASLPEAARGELDRLAACAGDSWTAPASGEPRERAYHLTGMVMLAQSDLLLALWDGRPSRGPGGTAAVIDQAVREGVPVVHIDPGGGATRVIWAGFSHVGPRRLDRGDAPNRPCDGALLDQLVAAALSPPTAPAQRLGLDTFLAERERRLRWRPEFPLLLAATGIGRLRRGHVIADPYKAATHAEWSDFHTALGALALDTHGLFSAVQEAFSWSDRLADHYAQVYRGGVILNYLAAALAVLVALSGILLPHAKPLLLTLELVCLAALISNTAIGNRQQWHRRWLDYRYLAEQLRPMRSLKLIGAFGPRPQPGPQAEADVAWTDWYAAAVWRSLALPPSLAGEAEIARIADEIGEHELEPQIRYHEGNAHRMHTLDHRLHQTGSALFVLSLASSFVGLVGYLLHIEAVLEAGRIFTVLGAALPTLGAALFGMRGQSDFAGAARRSAETARRLRRTADRLAARPISPSLAARLMEDAAQTMAADLGEWRATFVDRRLSIPS